MSLSGVHCRPLLPNNNHSAQLSLHIFHLLIDSPFQNNIIADHLSKSTPPSTLPQQLVHATHTTISHNNREQQEVFIQLDNNPTPTIPMSTTAPQRELVVTGDRITCPFLNPVVYVFFSLFLLSRGLRHFFHLCLVSSCQHHQSTKTTRSFKYHRS